MKLAFRYLVLFLLAAGAVAPATGQGKKKAEPKMSRVVVALPLGVAPGKETKVALRGFGLDQATDVVIDGGKGTAKIVGKGKAGIPDKNPEQVGDTQVEVLVTLEERASLTVVLPEGKTPPHEILVAAALPEKEPNDGFRQAQSIALPALIEGRIERPRDVDVFRIEGRAGQKLRAEVLAARHGSPLDAILTLYGAQGNEFATADGANKLRDAVLEATLPADGVYYLSLIDAHDAGSPIHAYRLRIE